jgi:hypothetical protein
MVNVCLGRDLYLLTVQYTSALEKASFDIIEYFKGLNSHLLVAHIMYQTER